MSDNIIIWPEYSEPKTAVSKLVQMPAYKIDAYSLADAYMKDGRNKRKREND